MASGGPSAIAPFLFEGGMRYHGAWLAQSIPRSRAFASASALLVAWSFS